MVLFELDFLGSTILSDLGFVKLLLHVVFLLFIALEAWAQFSLHVFSVLRTVASDHWANILKLLDISVLVLAEPVVEYTYWNILVIGPWLERAVLEFFFDALLPKLLDLESLVA